MASTNSVKIYDQTVEWSIEDSSSVSEATSTLAWYSTAAPATKHGGQPDSTDTFWVVRSITYLAGTTQTSGSPSFVRLLDKDSSGPILFQATFAVGGELFGPHRVTFEPPRRCRPIWFTSKSVDFATGGKFIFELA